MESFGSTCKFFNQISRDHFCWRQHYSQHYTSSYRDLTAFENILKVANWKKQYKIYQSRKNLLAGDIESEEYSNICPKLDSFTHLNSDNDSFSEKLPIYCTLWEGRNRKDLQVGQVVILLPSKDSHPNISDAKVCRISRKMKTKYRRIINYDFKYQELKVENGTLKGTGHFLKIFI